MSLRSEQYKTPSNLEARIELHNRFSQNPQGWAPWLFDQIGAGPNDRLLELGCGPAFLWRQSMERVPPGWRLVLSDFSEGMVDAARWVFAGSNLEVRFEVIDAAAIPLDDASVDWVLANHMLYHVPERAVALAEIRRVLRPGGCLLASTLGDSNLIEMVELVREATGRDGFMRPMASAPFHLENGSEQLEPFFAEIELRRYEDSLRVTEVAPLIGYLRSMILDDPFDAAEVAQIEERAQREIDAHGAFRVTKDGGAFIARTPG